MLKAILFDFNGVIINDEPLHFAAMREAVAGLGVDLSEKEYLDKYLPFDDVQCLEAITSDYSIRMDEEARLSALGRKSSAYRKLMQEKYLLCSGAREFVEAAAAIYPLAIASGARRQEIESTLESLSLRRYFVEIVAAEDFIRGKPHPESYLFALRRLNQSLGSTPIEPGECLVIEDSAAGVEGARAAGMPCLAVTTSYPRHRLGAANLVVDSLEEVPVGSLSSVSWNGSSDPFGDSV